MGNKYEPLPENYDLLGVIQKPISPPVGSVVEKKQYAPLPEGYNLPNYQEPISVPKDIGKGFASGFAEGTAMLPGAVTETLTMPEKLPSYATLGSIWLAEKMGLMPEESVANAQKAVGEMTKAAGKNAAEKKGNVEYHMGLPFPTPKGSLELAEKAGMPTYDPKTSFGKWAKITGSFIPQSVIPAGEETLFQRALTNTTAGAGAATGNVALEGTPYQTAGEILGGVTGGLAGTTGSAVLRSRSEPRVKQRAEDLAGRIVQEAVPDPRFTAQNLENLTTGPNAPEFLQGIEPTTPQLAREAGITGLSRRLEAVGQREDDPIHRQRMAQEQVNRDITQGEIPKLPDLVKTKIPNSIDIAGSYKLSGVNPQGHASENVAALVSTLESTASKAEKAAWENPALKNAGVFKDRALAEIDDFLENLNPVAREAFPPEIKNLIEAIRKEPGNTVPFQTFQDLRSLTRTKAAQAFNSQTPIKSPDLYKFVDKLKDVLSDTGNIRFNNKYAIDAWNEARKQSKQYDDMFGKGFMEKVIAEQSPGMPKIAPEEVLKRALTGPNAGQNVRQIRGVLGTAADEHIGDWMVGHLTENGSDISITPEKVRAFMAKPENAAIISEVPDLQQRLQSIAQKAGESVEQATQRQFQERLADAVRNGNPRTVVNFLDKHANELNTILPDPNDQRYVTALRNSAALIQSLPAGKMTSSRALDMLSNGSMMSLLYGRATGAITDATMGAVGGAIAAKATGMTGGFAPVAGAVLSASHTPESIVKKGSAAISGFFLNNTREKTFEILQEAARDPQLMKMLLLKPDPANISALQRYLSRPAAAVGRTSVRAVTPMALQSFGEGNREGRATGGRVGAKAEKLLRDLKRRKIMISNHTEQMLSIPDDAIVQALDAAKR